MNIRKVFQLVVDDIAKFYAYFFSFYFICVILAFFIESWALFFNWGYFHFFIILLGIFSLFSSQVKSAIFSFKDAIDRARFKDALTRWRVIVGRFRVKESAPKKIRTVIKSLFDLGRSALLFLILGFSLSRDIAKVLFRELANFIRRQMARLKKGDYIKIVLIIVVIAFSLYKKIEIFDFLVLSYALSSILFVIDSRVAAGVALILIAMCSIFFILNKPSWAELFAVYSYCFMAIMIFTGVSEYIRGDIKSNKMTQAQPVFKKGVVLKDFFKKVIHRRGLST
ncbi:MAG: hypothetical protein PHD51_03035 [Patescibacteria group bacterium]|nr:hypothetical protein [Patescibacteria group bacterium]MDD5490171.1 hypothetical protein [Patescibacteria group bacterium]